MRILRIAERVTPLPGGEEIHVEELTQRQVKRGHEVTLIYRVGDPSLWGVSDHRVTSLFPSRFSPGGLATAGFSLRAAGFVGRGDWEVIHVHGDFTDGLAISPRAKRLRTPSVITVHGGISTKHSSLAHWVLSGFDAVIAHGEYVREQLVDIGLDRERITTLSSGVNLDLITPHIARPGIQAVGKIIAVGSLVEIKNFSLLIRSYKRLEPSQRRGLVIVGDGPHRHSLQSLAEGESDIVFSGSLSRDQVYDEMSRASIFVMPSMRSPTKGEGIPTALLEAMTVGLDCLVSSECEPAPVVSDKGSYRSFNPRHEDELLALLKETLRDPVESRNRGRRAQIAVRNLDWNRVVESVEEVYRRAIHFAAPRKE